MPPGAPDVAWGRVLLTSEHKAALVDTAEQAAEEGQLVLPWKISSLKEPVDGLVTLGIRQSHTAMPCLLPNGQLVDAALALHTGAVADLSLSAFAWTHHGSAGVTFTLAAAKLATWPDGLRALLEE